VTGTPRLRRVLFVGVGLVGVAAFAWPFLLPAAVGGREAHEVDAPIVLLVLLCAVGLLLFVELGRGGMGPKTVALIAVLAAAMVALRLPGFIAGFSAMFIVVLIGGNAFGAAFGFLLGAIGTFASGMFVGGLGPWLPFQMIAVGWVGAGAGLLPKPSGWPLRVGILAAYGFAAAFAFGAVMNLWFWPFQAGTSEVGWAPELGFATNVRHYLTFYATTSAGWDVAGAIGNAILVVALGRPLLGSFDRIARRMNLTVHP
jgi:energy-coupling factor transport system substrate-specific component